MSDAATFGSAVIGASPVELLAAEPEYGRDVQMGAVDDLLHDLLRVGFGDGPLVEGGQTRGGAEVVRLRGVTNASADLIDAHYRLEFQESKGAWFLPQETTIKYGSCNMPFLVNTGTRFPAAAARELNARVDVRACRDGLAIWSLATPLFADLMAPIELRTSTGKPKAPEDQRRMWASVESSFASWGLHLDDLFTKMRFGGEWSTLPMDEHLELKRVFISTLRDQVSGETVRRWRAGLLLDLVAAYYGKAKRGTALSRTVLTKPMQQRLSALFGGDWLAFLAYLGEPPNDADEIVTSLPEPRLYVAGKARTQQVADLQGIPADEIQRIVAAFLGDQPGVSPVEARVEVMKKWWSAFDQLHAAQRSGMPSLWGLVDNGFTMIGNDRASTAYLYRSLLPPELTAEIDGLWDGIALPRWPSRIVSEFHPHHQMAQAFGPAIDFWDGIALTCWFVCEGPSSRTTVAGLRKYHHEQIVALEEAGAPIDNALFRELEDAQQSLGPVEPLVRNQTTTAVNGISLTVTMSSGSRRDGFEILRDIVTRHRRIWAAEYLDSYLSGRWEGELRRVATEFNRRTAARSKPPTFKMFASFATPVANHWFCGDLAALYAALGERAPELPERVDLLTGDPYAFVLAVYEALGGGPLPTEDNALQMEPHESRRAWDLARLASDSLSYLQHYEALGRRPTPVEFTAKRYHWEHLGGDQEGWVRYTTVIDETRTLPLTPPLALDEVTESGGSHDHESDEERSATTEDSSSKPPTARRWFDRLRGR